IKKSVDQHLNDLNISKEEQSIAFENSQARERTQVLMDYSNKVNGIVIGTGDLSEIALGWSTYNGDHMSMYNVNCSLPKTLIRSMTYYLSDVYPEIKEILLDILDTPISPELLSPKEGEIAQITEDVIGPYVLHDFFLYHFIYHKQDVKKVFFMAKETFKEDYDEKTIKKWFAIFIRRFFNNQFKRSCCPDGPKITQVSLSPRGDFRMPSDASGNCYLKELENL
ncbi:MAG: NAD(+) synthase, partial [Bacilli bacterium]|nr:NAD(+) synthase [Bacilli bacterium]